MIIGTDMRDVILGSRRITETTSAPVGISDAGRRTQGLPTDKARHGARKPNP